MTAPNIVFLLTATIDPRDTPDVKRADPKVREEDYIQVLEKLVTESRYPIVWCENSGYSLGRILKTFAHVPSERLEILQFVSQVDTKKGKGLGEIDAERYALLHSQLLASADYIAKLTGRYYLENIDRLLTPLLNGSRSIPLSILAAYRENSRYTFSGFFVATPRFFRKYFLTHADMLDDSKKQTMEVILNRAIRQASQGGEQWADFPEVPRVIGISGTWNVPVDIHDPNQIAWSWTKLRLRLTYYLKEAKKRVGYGR